MRILDSLTKVKEIQKKANIPQIFIGDIVAITIIITEGNKERLQQYEGTVIAKKSSGLNKTITVRRIFQGIGIEYVFPIHAKQVKSINIRRHSKIRRSKLFYLRNRVGKQAQLKTKILATTL